MESSQWDLFIDMVVDRFIFKNNLIKLSPSRSFRKTEVRIPKTGISFSCDPSPREAGFWLVVARSKNTFSKVYWPRNIFTDS